MNLQLLSPTELILDWTKNPRPKNDNAIMVIARHMNDIGYIKERPIIVYIINGKYYVGAGFHRCEAAMITDPELKDLPLQKVWTEIREGTEEDLNECMLIDNFKHDPETNHELGFTMSKETLKKTRIRILLIPKYFKMTDAALQTLGIGKIMTLGRIRKEVIAMIQDDKDTTLNISDDIRNELLDIHKSGIRIGTDGRKIDITKSGKRSHKNYDDIEIKLQKGIISELNKINVTITDIQTSLTEHFKVKSVKELNTEQCQQIIDLLNDDKIPFIETEFGTKVFTESQNRQKRELQDTKDTYNKTRHYLKDIYHKHDLSKEITIIDYINELYNHHVIDKNGHSILLTVFQNNPEYYPETQNKNTIQDVIDIINSVSILIENNTKIVQTFLQKYIDIKTINQLKLEISDHLLKPATHFCKTHNVTTEDTIKAIINIYNTPENPITSYNDISIDQLTEIRNNFIQGNTKELIDETISIRQTRLEKEKQADKTRSEMHRREVDDMIEKHFDKLAFYGYGNNIPEIQNNIYTYIKNRFSVDDIDFLRYGQWLEIRNDINYIITNLSHKSDIVDKSLHHQTLSEIDDNKIYHIIERMTDNLSLTTHQIENYIFKLITDYKPEINTQIPHYELVEYLEIFKQAKSITDKINSETGVGKEIKLLDKVNRLYGMSINTPERFLYPDPLHSVVSEISKLLSTDDKDFQYIGNTTQDDRITQYQKWIDKYDQYFNDAINHETNHWAKTYRNAQEKLTEALPILEKYGLVEVLITDIYKNKGYDITKRTDWTTDNLQDFVDDMQKVIDNPNNTSEWLAAFRNAITTQPNIPTGISDIEDIDYKPYLILSLPPKVYKEVIVLPSKLNDDEVQEVIQDAIEMIQDKLTPEYKPLY